MDNGHVDNKHSIYRPEYCDSSSHASLRCLSCSQLLDSICLTVAPNEADWFRRCIVEIEDHDGHLILERFLRLYWVFRGNNNIMGDRIQT
jgi:hypothetical protein